MTYTHYSISNRNRIWPWVTTPKITTKDNPLLYSLTIISMSNPNRVIPLNNKQERRIISSWQLTIWSTSLKAASPPTISNSISRLIRSMLNPSTTKTLSDNPSKTLQMLPSTPNNATTGMVAITPSSIKEENSQRTPGSNSSAPRWTDSSRWLKTSFPIITNARRSLRTMMRAVWTRAACLQTMMTRMVMDRTMEVWEGIPMSPFQPSLQ